MENKIKNDYTIREIVITPSWTFKKDENFKDTGELEALNDKNGNQIYSCRVELNYLAYKARINLFMSMKDAGEIYRAIEEKIKAISESKLKELINGK